MNPVLITALKRFVTGRTKDEAPLPQVEPKGEKIIIAGFSLAGLVGI